MKHLKLFLSLIFIVACCVALTTQVQAAEDTPVDQVETTEVLDHQKSITNLLFDDDVGWRLSNEGIMNSNHAGTLDVIYNITESSSPWGQLVQNSANKTRDPAWICNVGYTTKFDRSIEEYILATRQEELSNEGYQSMEHVNGVGKQTEQIAQNMEGSTQDVELTNIGYTAQTTANKLEGATERSRNIEGKLPVVELTNEGYISFMNEDKLQNASTKTQAGMEDLSVPEVKFTNTRR